MGGGEGGRAGQVLAGEWEQLFSYVTHYINLQHTALDFHQAIPKGYLIMVCTRTALETYQRDVLQKKRRQYKILKVGTNIYLQSMYPNVLKYWDT